MTFLKLIIADYGVSLAINNESDEKKSSSEITVPQVKLIDLKHTKHFRKLTKGKFLNAVEVSLI